MGQAWEWLKSMLHAGHGPLVVEIRKDTRSLAQNRLLHSIISDIAKQVEWPVDGKLQKLDVEDWKTILTSGLKKEQRVSQGIGGGWVMLGSRTSKMTKAELSELVEFAYSFGAQYNVKWSRTSLGRYYQEEDR